MTASTKPQFTLVPTGRCWICGGDSLERIAQTKMDLTHSLQFGEHAHAEYPPLFLVLCKTCGFAQPEAMPSEPDFFDKLYDQQWGAEWLKTDFDLGYKDYIFQRILTYLERTLPTTMPRSLIDIGSHVGRFIYLAKERGWDVQGVEANPRTSAFCEARTGLPVHRGMAQEFISAGKSFSVLSLIDVLEHIPQPVSVLRSLQDLITPGGLIAVKVPHGSKQLLKEKVRKTLLGKSDGVMVNLVHVNHFTASTLKRALVDAGYKNVRVEIAAPEFTPRGPKRTWKEAFSAAGRLAVFHIGRAIPLGVRSPLSLHLQAYATR